MAHIINCAHRGASSHAPENTLAALKLALNQGAAMAEIDIQQTADNGLVSFHDDDLDRTSNGSGPLWRRTVQQLKQLDAGSWFSQDFQGEKIPTLDEILTAMRGCLALNIEMKMHGHERDVETLLAQRLQKSDCLEWCLVTSFDHGAIDRLGGLLPGLKVGYIVGRNNWDDTLLDSWVSVLSLDKSLVTVERVLQIHAAGKEVHVWTVNEIEDMLYLRDCGVDVLIGNYPDRVAEFIK